VSSFPLVLCTGILRSGSTWSFNVCRLMAKVVAGREKLPLWTGYMLPEQSEPFFQRFGDSQPGPTVVKAHSLGPRGMEVLHAGKARAICTFRDPRDCVASMMTFANRPFDDAVSSISEALLVLESVMRSGHALPIRYEDMLGDPRGQIGRINGFLGLSLEAAILGRIDELCGMEASRRVCEELRHRPAETVLRSTEDHRVDPQTWLHDNHIQSGKAGRWKDEMQPWQVQVLSQAFDPWLARLGYEPARLSRQSATDAA
jgi:Sulfotransferase domain